MDPSPSPLTNFPAHPQPLSGREAPIPSLRPGRVATRAGTEQSRPFLKDPEGRGPHRTRAAEYPEGLATKSRANTRRRSGIRGAKEGGGASRARARTKCPDAALRQSGPERGVGGRGLMLERLGISTLPLCFNHQVASLPTLTSDKRTAKARLSIPRESPEERNKMATSTSPFYLLRHFPPQRCE